MAGANGPGVRGTSSAMTTEALAASEPRLLTAARGPCGFEQIFATDGAAPAAFPRPPRANRRRPASRVPAATSYPVTQARGQRGEPEHSPQTPVRSCTAFPHVAVSSVAGSGIHPAAPSKATDPAGGRPEVLGEDGLTQPMPQFGENHRPSTAATRAGIFVGPIASGAGVSRVPFRPPPPEARHAGERFHQAGIDAGLA